MNFLNPGNWGITEIVIILFIVLIFFGPKRLPELSRAIGKSVRDFKRGLTDIRTDIENADADDPAQKEAEDKREFKMPEKHEPGTQA